MASAYRCSKCHKVQPACIIEKHEADCTGDHVVNTWEPCPGPCRGKNLKPANVPTCFACEWKDEAFADRWDYLDRETRTGKYRLSGKYRNQQVDSGGRLWGS